ncbi:MAG: amidohydrolase family protein [Gemmatimonadota bacterium]
MRKVSLAAGALVAVALPQKRLAAQLAVRGETVYTMAGAPITDGVVVIGKDGHIERVGPAASTTIPAGYKLLRAKVVTPGLIDAHSVVGLAGMLNYAHDQDELDTSDPIQPQLRAFDAYNARERLIEWVRSFGVTTLHTGHGPGALMSGQTMVVKTRGNDVAEAMVDSVTMVAMTLGSDVSRNFKSPGTKAKEVAMLRAEFIKAREYRAKLKNAKPEEPPARDLALEAVVQVLDRKVPALITAQSVTEIMDALRLQKEFGFRLVLDGAAESYLLIDQIKAAGVPIILHPTMVRLEDETANATIETAKLLHAAGIPVALQSGFESYVPKTRVVLFEAAMAASNGLPKEAALATITSDAAKIIGQERRIGSLEAGKDGDLALFDGDPFEWTTHVCTVIIEGVVVSDSCK